MSRIKIKTLTMVHIGSGNMLHNNSDFVTHYTNDCFFLSVIDPNKMLNFIKEEHISDWILSIENGTESTKDLVNRFSKNTSPSQYSKREIQCYANNLKNYETLKECIHNGMGIPYIPGSSIKGAIRTAILSFLTQDMDAGFLSLHIKDLKGNIKANKLESTLFGNNPNSDVFRFLQVSDAYFTKGCEIATRMINLNHREKKDLKDLSKPQLIEAIATDEETEFQLKLSTDYYKWAKEHWNDKEKKLGNLPDEMFSIEALFDTINKHTQKLLEEEINSWKSISEDKEGADSYIAMINNLLTEARSCKKGKECVLRIGHGSGWNFITGAWSVKLDEFETQIVPAARPKNAYYKQYEFPKTRRIDEDNEVLGFVKLSLL